MNASPVRGAATPATFFHRPAAAAASGAVLEEETFFRNIDANLAGRDVNAQINIITQYLSKQSALVENGTLHIYAYARWFQQHHGDRYHKWLQTFDQKAALLRQLAEAEGIVSKQDQLVDTIQRYWPNFDWKFGSKSPPFWSGRMLITLAYIAKRTRDWQQVVDDLQEAVRLRVRNRHGKKGVPVEGCVVSCDLIGMKDRYDREYREREKHLEEEAEDDDDEEAADDDGQVRPLVGNKRLNKRKPVWTAKQDQLELAAAAKRRRLEMEEEVENHHDVEDDDDDDDDDEDDDESDARSKSPERNRRACRPSLTDRSSERPPARDESEQPTPRNSDLSVLDRLAAAGSRSQDHPPPRRPSRAGLSPINSSDLRVYDPPESTPQPDAGLAAAAAAAAAAAQQMPPPAKKSRGKKRTGALNATELQTMRRLLARQKAADEAAEDDTLAERISAIDTILESLK